MTDQRSPLARRATRRGLLKTTAALGALGALSQLLAACGGSDSAASTAAPTSPSGAATPSGAAGLSDEQVRAILAKRIDEEKRGVGIVVGRIGPDGRSVVSHGLTRAGGPPVGADTLFEIGSVTKTFTGAALAAMIAKGEVAADDPIATLLPKGTRVPERNGAKIALRHLVSHISGLPRLPDGFTPPDITNPYADYSVDDLYAFLARYELPRDIGAEYEYSNLGMGLLGHGLALRAGTDYERLIKERIAGPLGMKDTMITLDPAKPIATGHDEGGDAAPYWDIPSLAGAGALRSTANDLVAFLAANLGLAQSDLMPALQSTHAPQHTISPELKIGMAWHITPRPEGDLVWHNGGTGGFVSFIGFDAKRRTGVVVLSNRAISVDDIGFHLLDPSRPLDAPPKPHVRAEVDPQILARYVGEYELAPDFILTVKAQQGALIVQATGQGPLLAYPESETSFFLSDVDAQLTFDVDGAGKATAVTLHQGGQNMPGKKIK
ncbi:MAG TPA: serine hydrolase [Herpetosiphonaceae bacterium]